MAYPNNTEITSAANTIGVDPIEVYAFAAMHGKVPANNGDIQEFASQVHNTNVWWDASIGDVFRYAYIQANGGFPNSSQTFITWMIKEGYSGPTGALAGPYPFAGEGYPPGNQPTNPTTAPTDNTKPQPSGLDLSGLVKNPLVLGGLALGGAYALGIFPRRR